tara:strand:- start:280 stop:1191 length:912 start_codon:yes stop_codon:yes gene_type:complete
MNKSNLITKIFQNIVKDKDIRKFKKNFFYYIFFRIIRRYLDCYIEIKIYGFKIFASNKKNQISHALIKKCNFDDQSELKIIKKFSTKKKIYLLDCGCNYGFYSFFTASLSDKNFIIAIEASPETTEDFNKNLNLNNFKNIILKNFAISDEKDKEVIFNESENDWESSLSHNKFYEKKLSNIKTTTIDALLDGQDIKDYFLLIKLDIEGHEFHAIKGGINSIKKYNPIIIIELSKYILDNNGNFNFLEIFLIDFDYSIYDTDNNPVNLVDVIELLNNLDIDHKTIGNYYLIKNNDDIKKILTDE